MIFSRRDKESICHRLRVALWPRRSWTRSLEYIRKRILRLRATPHAIAAGFAAGAFASFTPLMGFHFILAALLAFATRGNIIASAFGTFVGNPLTFPLIWGATYSLGARILGSGGKHSEATELHSHLTWSNFSLEAVWPLVWPMIVGGVILGALVWVLMYFPIRAMIASYQNKRAARISRREAATQAAE